jgi:dTDP-4-amino-4,6-dideoxygalactose transaminase
MTDCEPIPFLDLVSPHRELENELLDGVRRALRSASFIGGPALAEFEESFAAFCQTRFCVGVGSGTDALRFAIIAAGIGAGDTVITVPNTFIATAEAISQSGAFPDFVDIDERTGNMDPFKLKRYLEAHCTLDPESARLVSRRTGRRIAGIIPVHLYGQMADMDPILRIAETFGLTVIEDACQAHGAEYYSRQKSGWFRAGSMGRAAGFSFYPGKNLGACGEAGAITTDDQSLARLARMLRDHGQAEKYHHEVEGYNGRLDSIQARFLNVKLAYLEGWNEQRREAARRYHKLLDGTGIGLPFIPEGNCPVFHLFVVRVRDRAGLMKHLAAKKIGTAIHYPIPLHLQNAYRYLAYRKGDFPVAERVAEEILSLPMFPQITPDQQARVAEAILEFQEHETPAASANMGSS